VFEMPYMRLKALNRKAQLLKLLTGDGSIQVMPTALELQNTAFCNLSCPFCESHGTEKLRQQNNRIKMNQELLYRLADEGLPYAKSYSLTVSGEPLASPGFYKILSDLSKYGTKLRCTTNGTLLKGKVLPAFILGSEAINISLDGASKETFERLRLGAKYEEVLENVYLFSRVVSSIPSHLRPVVSFALTIMGSTLEELPGMIYMAHKTGVRVVTGHFMVSVFDDFKNDEVHLHKARYNAALQESLRLAQEYDVEVIFPPVFADVASDEDICFPAIGQGYYQELDDIIASFDCDENKQKVRDVAEKVVKKAAVEGSDLSVESQLAMDEWESDLNRVIEKHDNSLIAMLHSDDKIKFCKTLLNRMYINPQGQVAPCCYIPMTITNVESDSIRSVWNGKSFNNFRRTAISDDAPKACLGCPQIVEIPADLMASEVLSSPGYMENLEKKEKKIVQLHQLFISKDEVILKTKARISELNLALKDKNDVLIEKNNAIVEYNKSVVELHRLRQSRIYRLKETWENTPFGVRKLLRLLYLLAGAILPSSFKRSLLPLVMWLREKK